MLLVICSVLNIVEVVLLKHKARRGIKTQTQSGSCWIACTCFTKGHKPPLATKHTKTTKIPIHWWSDHKQTSMNGVKYFLWSDCTDWVIISVLVDLITSGQLRWTAVSHVAFSYVTNASPLTIYWLHFVSWRVAITDKSKPMSLWSQRMITRQFPL